MLFSVVLTLLYRPKARPAKPMEINAKLVSYNLVYRPNYARGTPHKSKTEYESIDRVIFTGRKVLQSPLSVCPSITGASVHPISFTLFLNQLPTDRRHWVTLSFR